MTFQNEDPQPQIDANTANETNGVGERSRKDKKKKEPAPRYDIMWECMFCFDKLREGQAQTSTSRRRIKEQSSVISCCKGRTNIEIPN